MCRMKEKELFCGFLNWNDFFFTAFRSLILFVCLVYLSVCLSVSFTLCSIPFPPFFFPFYTSPFSLYPPSPALLPLLTLSFLLLNPLPLFPFSTPSSSSSSSNPSFTLYFPSSPSSSSSSCPSSCLSFTP